MITVLISISSVFVDSGFSTWLIRKPDCSQEDYSTAFFFNIFVSTLFYILFYILSNQISVFLNMPELSKIIKVYGIVLFLDSFAIVHRVKLTKIIDFRLQMLISVISASISATIGLLLAFNGYGIWSLVLQSLSKQFSSTLLLWYYTKWIPSINFSLKSFQELFHFGYKILFSGLIASIQNNIYYFIIGKYFSPSNLGYYTRAEQFNAIVSSNIALPLERVFFPALSLIQFENERLRNVLRKTIKTSFLLVVSLLLFLIIISKPLIIVLIGEKWVPSVIMLQLICLSTIFYPINSLNLNILKIIGRSDLILKLQIIKIIMFIPNIIIAVLWGIIPMLVSRIITTLICTIINSHYSKVLVDYKLKQQLFDVLPILFIILIALVPTYLCSFFDIKTTIKLVIHIILGPPFIILLLEAFKQEEYIEIKKLSLNFLHEKVFKKAL
jgi:O-antigen/teichoic acid export membrane protein